MRTFPRPSARIGAGALALVLVACGTTTSSTPPSASGSDAPSPSASASASASADPAAAAAYGAAICPLFERIVNLDPRLAAIRAAGAEGGDMTPHGEEVDAIADELGAIVTELDAVPMWSPGRRLQFELLTALHGIRAELLKVSRDLDAFDADDTMAALPYVASQTMDRAMQKAVEGGLTCETGE